MPPLSNVPQHAPNCSGFAIFAETLRTSHPGQMRCVSFLLSLPFPAPLWLEHWSRPPQYRHTDVQNSIIKTPNLITFQCEPCMVHNWSHQLHWEFPVLGQKIHQCTCAQNSSSSLSACSRSVIVISSIENQNVEWRHPRAKDSREGWLRDVCTHLAGVWTCVHR